jgi:hypothetical protein
MNSLADIISEKGFGDGEKEARVVGVAVGQGIIQTTNIAYHDTLRTNPFLQYHEEEFYG